MLDGEEFSQLGDPTKPFSYLNTQPCMRNKKYKNKRRFSDDQIRSLETIFESESRVEPRKKMQLARELGLQPRQVAIWFQNKRARWKSKQLEQDYSILQENFNKLASQFDALKKEKQALMFQLEKLKDMIHKSEEESKCCRQEQGGVDHESDNEDHTVRCESEVNPAISFGGSDKGLGVFSDDDDSSIRAEYFGLEEEPNLMSIVEPLDGSSTSSEDWGNLDTKDLFDQSSSTYQWWDFWS